MRDLSILLLAVAPLFADSVAGVTWTPPAGWKSQGERPMRAATYAVPPAAGDSEPGECAVFYFGQGQGGSIPANIDRWLGQFQEKPATAPQPKKQTIAGFNVTTVEHAGTYMSGAPMAPVKTPKPGFKLIGAIVEAPEGNVFFKLTGPAKTIAAQQATFQKMLASMKK